MDIQLLFGYDIGTRLAGFLCAWPEHWEWEVPHGLDIWACSTSMAQTWLEVRGTRPMCEVELHARAARARDGRA